MFSNRAINTAATGLVSNMTVSMFKRHKERA